MRSRTGFSVIAIDADLAGLPHGALCRMTMRLLDAQNKRRTDDTSTGKADSSRPTVSGMQRLLGRNDAVRLQPTSEEPFAVAPSLAGSVWSAVRSIVHPMNSHKVSGPVQPGTARTWLPFEQVGVWGSVSYRRRKSSHMHAAIACRSWSIRPPYLLG